MKHLAVLLLSVTFFFASCSSMSTYEVKDLYGQWQGETWGFTFNEDGSCVILRGGQQWPGETTWRQVSIGNTLELIADGKVIMSNVTVKGIENDVLSLEMRPMIGAQTQTTEIHKLNRVK